MKLKFNPELLFTDFIKLDKLEIPQQLPIVYSQFPCCEKVQLIGLMSSEGLFSLTNGEIELLSKQKYDPTDHINFYESLIKRTIEDFNFKFGISLEDSSPIIAILRKHTEGIKTLSGATI